MVLTKFPKSEGFAAFSVPETVFLACLLILPYASYAALVGMGGITVWVLLRYGQALWQLLHRQGWIVLGLGMIVTAVTAQNRIEAGLQLANFLPFYLYFGILAVWVRHLARPIDTFETWALGLVIGSIPVSLCAGVEYYLRSPSVIVELIDLPQLAWLYSRVDYGHRASSFFGHPNVLAAYLVVVLGLGLGLCLKLMQGGKLAVPSAVRWRYWPLIIYGTLALTLGGIFCSGSRNGVMVAVVQLLVFGWLMRRNRLVVMAGLAGVTAVLLAVIAWGIGGRSLGEAVSTTSLRMDVWQLALNLIRQHPWLGVGLGGFKLSYVPYTIPEYDSVEHAHNLWLMLAAEIGIPLMLLFTFIVGRVCDRAFRNLLLPSLSRLEKSVLVGYGLAFLGCTLFALSDVTFYDSRVNVLGWLMLAALQAIPGLVASTSQSQFESA